MGLSEKIRGIFGMRQADVAGKQNRSDVSDQVSKTRNAVCAASDHAELNKNMPRWRFDFDVSRELRNRVEPALTDIWSAMHEIYGDLSHTCNTVSVKSESTDNPLAYGASAQKEEFVDLLFNNASNKLEVTKRHTTSFETLVIQEADWGHERGNLGQILAHELGHIGFGTCLPMHYPLQEFFAEVNRLLITKKYPGRQEKYGAVSYSVADDELPIVLAGDQKWDIPEDTILMYEGGDDAVMIAALYKAWCATFLRAIGNDLDKLQLIARETIKLHKTKCGSGRQSQKEYPVPSLSEWVSHMSQDHLIKGFKDKLEAGGLFGEDAYMQDGKKIIVVPSPDDVWGADVAAIRFRRNPELFRLYGSDTNKWEHKKVPSDKFDTRYGFIKAVPCSVALSFPGFDGYGEKSEGGSVRVCAMDVYKLAKDLNVPLAVGSEIKITIKDEENMQGEHIIEWNDRSEEMVKNHVE